MAFSWRTLLALTLPWTCGASNRFPPQCANVMTFPALFWTGAMTDGGQTPADYFRDHHDKSGRPRYVLLGGAPGAGKSTWAKAAKAAGWTFVACDDVRVDLLAEWRAAGRHVLAAGGHRVLADPKDGSQFWDPDVVDEMIRRTKQKATDALAAKVPVVIEAAGPHLMPIRAARMSEANRAGYAVEGLFFTADGPKNFIENTRLRQATGGTAPMPALVTLRFAELSFFGNPFRVDRKHKAKEEVPEVMTDFDWMEALPESYKTLEEALAAMDPTLRTKLERYLAEDVFHRVDFVWVPHFGK